MKNFDESPQSFSSNSNLGGKTIPLIIILLLVGTTVFFGYKYLFNSKGSDNQNNNTNTNININVDSSATATPSVTTTTEVSPTFTIPNGWEKVENTFEGYTVYRPKSWYYKIFGGGTTLGMDPNKIPEASEYVPVITINKIEISVDEEIISLTSQLEPGYTQTSVTINGVDYKITEGTLPANELFDAKKLKAAITSVNEKTYEILLESAPSAFNGYKDEFDTVLNTIQYF